MKKVFIIAEAGVNHNNKLSLAKRLVNVAKRCGADAVKFQVFKTENYVAINAPVAKYQKKNTNETNQYDLIKKLELTEINLKKIIKYCKKKKIMFLASAFDDWGINFLKKQKIKIFKIPSGEINNYIYLEQISKIAKSIILSTGMSKLSEVSNAINFLLKKNVKKKQISLLQCNTEYPTPYNDLNLNVIQTYKKKFNVDVGLSDHSIGDTAPVIAVALGASIIEKHLTLNKKMKGPDHKASMEPRDFKEMVRRIRIAEISRGSYKKRLTNSEKKNIKIARKSIYAIKFIKKGQFFSKKNVGLKRPAFGLGAEKIYNVLGRRAKKNFFEDELIKI